MSATPTRGAGDGGAQRTRRIIAAALAGSSLGSIGLLVAYWGGHGPQAEGLGLAVAFGGLAVAFGAWGTRAVPGRVAVERRGTMPSAEQDRAGVEQDAGLEDTALGGADAGRRRGLLALAGLAGTSLLAGLASPLRSLGPQPFPRRRVTGWRAGSRLVDADGLPVRVSDLDVGSIATVFPEGDEHDRSDSQVILIRLPDGALDGSPGAEEPRPGGHVAYSKVCTHAGCPVAQYDADTHELLCPCHQSVFLATEGARPTFGPAARPLPRLPIDVDADGYLVARGDFPEAVGPSYWSRP